MQELSPIKDGAIGGNVQFNRNIGMTLIGLCLSGYSHTSTQGNGGLK